MFLHSVSIVFGQRVGSDIAPRPKAGIFAPVFSVNDVSAMFFAMNCCVVS